MKNYDIIKQAIQNKKCVTCNYKGYLRKMTPHVLGIKNGKHQALFYQYDGHSSSGLSSDSTKNWRCVLVDEIENLKINEDDFQTSYNHSKTQTCVDNIDIEINF